MCKPVPTIRFTNPESKTTLTCDCSSYRQGLALRPLRNVIDCLLAVSLKQNAGLLHLCVPCCDLQVSCQLPPVFVKPVTLITQ